MSEIGLTKGVVEIRPYSPQWPVLFEDERTLLQCALGIADEQHPIVVAIEHIGSTAVAGLAAKPVLDIGVGVRSFEVARKLVPALEALGYEYRGELGIPHRHYFTKGEPRTHHLHMLDVSSDEWRNHLLFRDYLRTHPEARESYEGLKRSLARRFPTDREGYTDAKAEFITSVLKEAVSAEARASTRPIAQFTTTT